MSVEVVTFGCRLNAAESEVIRREAERAGFADTVVVNTCAVTAEAVRQARQAIRALRRERPQAKIVVTGCAAQTEPQTFTAMAEADRRARQWREAVAPPAGRKPARRSIAAMRRRRSSATSWRSRKPRRIWSTVLPAAPALSSKCRTAAIIAAPSASFRSAAAIRARCRWARWSTHVRRLVANDYREIVLTGVDITSYGADLPGAPKLGALVKQILKARAGAQAAAAVLDRFGRGRPRSARCLRAATSG